MSVKPRTIDNLGLESSKRYAEDQKILSPGFIEESRLIPQKAETYSIRPYTGDLDPLLIPGKQVLWANFPPPPPNYIYARLFTHQLIPSLGGYEKADADLEKLQSVEDALKKGQDDNGRQEKERKALRHLLECIRKLDKTLSLINARRNQYQRG